MPRPRWLLPRWRKVRCQSQAAYLSAVSRRVGAALEARMTTADDTRQIISAFLDARADPDLGDAIELMASSFRPATQASRAAGRPKVR